jgi:hypothetical protein
LPQNERRVIGVEVACACALNFFRGEASRNHCGAMIDGICRKFAMKNSAPREFCTVKIFGTSLFFRRTINRLSIAQVR